MSTLSSMRMNLEYKVQVNSSNHDLPKMLSRVEYEIAELSRLFSTLTLYVQKLKVANAHIISFFFSVNENTNLLQQS